MLEDMIYDRTAADVAAKNEKGVYNASDLDRVSAALNAVSARLTENGYAVGAAVRTGWTAADDVRAGDLYAVTDGIKTVRRSFAMFADTPAAPESYRHLTFSGANDIERILYDADLLLDNIEAARVFSGEVFSGEV